jgi:hypothetical protein
MGLRPCLSAFDRLFHFTGILGDRFAILHIRVVDGYVNLLFHVYRKIAVVKAVDHLKHARVHPIGAFTGERSRSFGFGSFIRKE